MGILLSASPLAPGSESRFERKEKLLLCAIAKGKMALITVRAVFYKSYCFHLKVKE